MLRSIFRARCDDSRSSSGGWTSSGASNLWSLDDRGTPTTGARNRETIYMIYLVFNIFVCFVSAFNVKNFFYWKYLIMYICVKYKILIFLYTSYGLLNWINYLYHSFSSRSKFSVCQETYSNSIVYNRTEYVKPYLNYVMFNRSWKDIMRVQDKRGSILLSTRICDARLCARRRQYRL